MHSGEDLSTKKLLSQFNSSLFSVYVFFLCAF